MGKLLSLTVACLPVVAFAARPDRNAYLNTAVNSVAGLVSEVKHDPEVADRYERHFEMTKPELISMFSQLHVARLEHDQPVTMYSVPEGGAIKMHHSVMKKGTLVFEDAAGTVVLKLKCGNPIVPGQELTEIAAPADAIASTTVLRDLQPDLVFHPDSNDAIAMTMQPETNPDITVDQITKEPTQVVNNITNSTTTTTYGSSSNGLGALWAIIPAGALVGIVATQHHCCCSNPTPAPEPVSMTLLATGAAGLVFKRRRQG